MRDMGDMFADSQFNGSISNWDVSKVINMKCMFDGYQFDGDISNWNITSLIDGKDEIIELINRNKTIE